MLKGIDPLIGPEVLAVLAQMGHGDEIAMVDANFPAASVAARTVCRNVLHMDRDAIRCLRAVLSLLPLDRYEPDPVLTMQVVGDPDAIPEVVAEAAPLLAHEGIAPASLERFAFYRRAEGCFAILRTAERRPYGNFILRKGVIGG
ncbi:RbsD/FucU family protein [Paracoccus sp. MKU1]|uniref:RbsD/FucU family protein n=1 Tax=Paracoccus sp. MKU1 TaxID=1745182 RepID=UPI0007193306|nr:RbsD/FucU domain-containing protein [Paracoccus sp. MKU1]KRW95246.1 ribose ABC transporter [Paracoccus sp. MKU1]